MIRSIFGIQEDSDDDVIEISIEPIDDEKSTFTNGDEDNYVEVYIPLTGPATISGKNLDSNEPESSSSASSSLVEQMLRMLNSLGTFPSLFGFGGSEVTPASITQETTVTHHLTPVS